MTKISLVVPCFNEEEALPLFFEEVSRVLRGMSEQDKSLSFEVVLVDDGSEDGTLDVMRRLSREYETEFETRYLSFSRNFGKEAGLYAGLRMSRGDYVATLDADMQDPPSLLPRMYDYVKNGEYDSVATRRSTRQGEPVIRSMFAHAFYGIMNKLSDIELVDGARDYRLMSRKMVDAILEMSEYNRFSKGIYGWIGFKTKWLSFENVERVAGETKWNFLSLLAYSFEGITAFSTKPLALASLTGIAFCFMAILGLALIIARTLAFGDPVAGWPSMVCIILLVGGVQLLCMGIFGQYLAKTYLETKHRPLYIAKECSDDEQDG